jgi:hypothetical protein
MAATIVGLNSITFGGSAETVAVFTSFSQTSDSDKTIVVNEDGDHVAVAYHGKKSVANMSGYLKSTTPTDRRLDHLGQRHRRPRRGDRHVFRGFRRPQPRSE